MAKTCGLSYTLRCKNPKGHKGRCHFVGDKRLNEATPKSKKLVLPKRPATVRDLALIAEWMGLKVDILNSNTFTLQAKDEHIPRTDRSVRGGRFSASGGTES